MNCSDKPKSCQIVASDQLEALVILKSATSQNALSKPALESQPSSATLIYESHITEDPSIGICSLPEESYTLASNGAESSSISWQELPAPEVLFRLI